VATIYDYNLHDLGQSAFQSIQERALLEQSLQDAPPPAPPVVPAATSYVEPAGIVRKVVIGGAVLGAVVGVLYIGNRMLRGA
jgi:hypothetical protein